MSFYWCFGVVFVFLWVGKCYLGSGWKSDDVFVVLLIMLLIYFLFVFCWMYFFLLWSIFVFDVVLVWMNKRIYFIFLRFYWRCWLFVGFGKVCVIYWIMYFFINNNIGDVSLFYILVFFMREECDKIFFFYRKYWCMEWIYIISIVVNKRIYDLIDNIYFFEFNKWLIFLIEF